MPGALERNKEVSGRPGALNRSIGKQYVLQDSIEGTFITDTEVKLTGQGNKSDEIESDRLTDIYTKNYPISPFSNKSNQRIRVLRDLDIKGV